MAINFHMVVEPRSSNAQPNPLGLESRIPAVTELRMRGSRVLLVAFCLGACATESARNPPSLSPEGRWAVRLSGKPVEIISLTRNDTAVGGWSGTRTTAVFMMSEQHSFSGVQGPVSTVPIVWSNQHGGLLRFKAGTDSDVYTLRVLKDGRALLGWAGRPFKPVVLTRALAPESVPDVWEFTKVFEAEDGHF